MEDEIRVTLRRAPGFGFGVGIKELKAAPPSTDTSIFISDVMAGGPSVGLIELNDTVVMINGVNLENVNTDFAIQLLRKCVGNADIILKRKRTVPRPMVHLREREPRHHDEPIYEEMRTEPSRAHSGVEEAVGRRSGPSGWRRDSECRGSQHTPPCCQCHHVANVTLVRSKNIGDAFGLKLCSHIFVKEIHHEGLAARSNLQEGDIVLKMNERTLENHTLDEVKEMVAKSKGNLEMLVQRNDMLVNIPDIPDDDIVYDSPSTSASQTQDVGASTSSGGTRTTPPNSFGGATGSGVSSTQQPGTTLKFNPPSGSDPTPTKHQCITAMKEYEKKSLEELRLEDYQAGRKGLSDPFGGAVTTGSLVFGVKATATPNTATGSAATNTGLGQPTTTFGTNISEQVHSLVSDHSNGCHGREPSSQSHSPELSDQSKHTPSQFNNDGSDEESLPKPLVSAAGEEKPLPLLPEPVYVQPRKHGVDLLASPSDAPMPSAAQDGCIDRSNMKLVKFTREETLGLTLAGGNDVGLFVGSVVPDSPAAIGGLEEGDHILRVNNFEFENIIREEAVLFLMGLPVGGEVTIVAQKTEDVYREILKSNAADSFYIRTHFEYKKESQHCLSFSKGDLFRVMDSLYSGTLGSWLAIRLDTNRNEIERGIIPNQNRAEQLSLVQYKCPKHGGQQAGGNKAAFWTLQSLRSSSRNLRKSREDLSAQPFQTKFPAYERMVLSEAGFLRPVVIFGPIADVAREKLAREDPDSFQLTKTEPRDAATDQRSSGIIRLQTITEIIERGKHAVLDISPNAVGRLSYTQWHPIVVFLNPDNPQGVRKMRTRLCPESRYSSRKLYQRAIELKRNMHHLFTETIYMNSMNDGWYGALKEAIQQQQKQRVWVTTGKVDGAPQGDLDVHDDSLSYLSARGSEYSMYSTDSRHTSSYQDTDSESGTWTDQDLDETLTDEVSLASVSTLTRSSESVREEPTIIQDTRANSGYLHPVQPDRANRLNPTVFKMGASQRNYRKDLYSMETPLQVNHRVKPPVRNQDTQPYLPYGYNRGDYDNRVFHYNERQPSHDQQTSRQPVGSLSVHQPPVGYSSYYPQPHFDRLPSLGSDDKLLHSQPGPVRYGKPLSLLPAACNPRSPDGAEPQGFPINSPRSPDLLKQCNGDSAVGTPNHHPGSPNWGLESGMLEPVVNFDPPTPSPELESPPPSPASGCIAPPPSPLDESDEDSAVEPQSVRSRVKLFENNTPVIVDMPTDVAAPGPPPQDETSTDVATPGPAPQYETSTDVATPGPAPQDETSTDVATPGPALQYETSTYSSTETPPVEDSEDEDVRYYKDQLAHYARRMYIPTKPQQ